MALPVEVILMRPTIKFRVKDRKFRCPFCRARRPAIKDIAIHMSGKHSCEGVYSFTISDTPNHRGSYPFKVTGLCGCGCGESIEYPRPNVQNPGIPDHAPPFLLSGHNSRVQPPNPGTFKKGHITWNTGLKGMGICKPNSGSFKKGNVPKTDRGGLWTDPRGQVYEWTGEYQPSGTRKYKARSRRIMGEKLGRPLRSDEVVIHLDGKASNDDPANLDAITKAQNAINNRWKGYTAKKKVKKKARVKVKKKVEKIVKSDIVEKVTEEIIEESKEDIIEIGPVPIKVVEPICVQCGMLIIPPGNPCPRC